MITKQDYIFIKSLFEMMDDGEWDADDCSRKLRDYMGAQKEDNNNQPEPEFL